MGYIERFPQPLLDDIVRNRCLPVVGAGFSVNADTPPGRKIPLWEKLGDELAKEIPDYPKSSPLDIISAYSHEFSRSKLIERLGSLLLLDEAKPGNTHAAFCQCHFDMVITTNFDFLLERGYEKVEKYCNPIVEEDQLTIGGKDPHVTLLKFHGDLRHPGRLVVTEDDYDTFLDRYPLLSTFLANLLIVRTPLLVGYSLEDPDFRHIWQLIGDRLGRLRRPAYVLAVDAKQSDIARYVRRGVKVINLPGKKENYPLILAEVFKEISDYWSRNLPAVSTVVEDRTLADLSLPPDAATRLCYFSVPQHMVSFYRNMIFPLADQAGLTPMSVEDLISPTESVTAKISAILTRADIVVVESDNRWVLHEIRRRGPSKVKVLVVTAEDTDEKNIGDWHVVKRPKVQYWDSAEFLKSMSVWLDSVSRELQPHLIEEPMRLLTKSEYRPAVVSAVGLLETHLRASLENYKFILGTNVRTHLGGFKTVGVLLRDSEEIHLLPPKMVLEIRRWLHIRNEALHMGKSVNRATAHQVVKGVMNAIKHLDSTMQETAATDER